MLHEARLLARQQARARAAGPQRLLARDGGQHGIHVGKLRQALQRAYGREDHEELPGLVPRQGVCWAHPDGLELLGLVGHRLLPFGHARHQKGHGEALR